MNQKLQLIYKNLVESMEKLNKNADDLRKTYYNKDVKNDSQHVDLAVDLFDLENIALSLSEMVPNPFIGNDEWQNKVKERMRLNNKLHEIQSQP